MADADVARAHEHLVRADRGHVDVAHDRALRLFEHQCLHPESPPQWLTRTLISSAAPDASRVERVRRSSSVDAARDDALDGQVAGGDLRRDPRRSRRPSSTTSRRSSGRSATSSIGSTVASPTNSPVCTSVPAPAQRARSPPRTRAGGRSTRSRRRRRARPLARAGTPGRRPPPGRARWRRRAPRRAPGAPGSARRCRRSAAPAARGAERGQRADRPGPGDEHLVARADAAALDAVGGDRRRLDQRALLVGDAVREPDDLVLGDARELGHPAPRVAEPDAGHRRAQVLQPAPAVRAVTAVDQRHDRDAVARARRASRRGRSRRPRPRTRGRGSAGSGPRSAGAARPGSRSGRRGTRAGRCRRCRRWRPGRRPRRARARPARPPPRCGGRALRGSGVRAVTARSSRTAGG